jgi:hypothetical protein
MEEIKGWNIRGKAYSFINGDPSTYFHFVYGACFKVQLCSHLQVRSDVFMHMAIVGTCCNLF